MRPRAGLDGRKISSPPEFDPRTVQPVAQSLYRLSCPAYSIYIHTYIHNSPLFVSKISVHIVVSCRNTVLCFSISISRIVFKNS